ncbi:MAG: YdeI/OmpD-associated family protein [Cardiobacteriaceae bacterium]|nr:YdeI/OmpD-associated family protein [Cardiobacteriaceae bacterium]
MDKLPDDFAQALTAHPDAETRFLALPPSHRREYLKWIAEAKRADTRARRIAQAIARIIS